MIPKHLKNMRTHARDLFLAGIRAVDAYAKTEQSLRIDEKTLIIHGDPGQHAQLDLDEFRHIYLIGFGKAAGNMARAAEDILKTRLTDGIIIIPYGHRVQLSRSRVIQAAHPVPDTQSLDAARQIEQLGRRASEQDLVICLLSGGGSALCSLPLPGISIQNLSILNQLLLASGASIDEINAVRKHVSQIKGGQLARFISPATLVSLIISDVVADRLDSIASGPTAPDTTTFEQAYDVLKKYQLTKLVPPDIIRVIEAGVRGHLPETPKVNDPVFRNTSNFIISRNLDALRAIRQQAEGIGYQTLILTSRLQGDTRKVARIFGAMIKSLTSESRSRGALCIITGGEMTVRVTGKGKGGRNCDFGLSLVPLISGRSGTVVLSAGTDGTDGPTDAAGVIVPSRERLMIHPLDFSVGEGYCNAQVLTDFVRGGPSRLRVSGHAEDVDALEVYRELLNQENILRGTLRGDFYLAGDIGSNFLRSSHGRFSIQIKDGVLRQFPVLSKVFSLLNVSQIFASQLPDMDLEGMPYEILTANFQLDKGILRSEDLTIRSEAMNQSYTGQIDLVSKEVDLAMAIHPLGTVDKIITRIPVAGWLLTGKDKALLTAHFSVSGPVDDVSVMIMPLDTLSEPTIGLLRRTLGLPFKLLEDPQILWGGDPDDE